MFLIVFAALVFFAPNYLGDPNNFIPANPLQTPADIVPEWYFLPYYAILRSVPNKLLGVCMMFGSLLVLFVPALARYLPSSQCPIPADLPATYMGVGRCGDPAGRLRCAQALGNLGHSLAGQHRLLFPAFPGDPADTREAGGPLPLPESISQPVLRGRGGGGGPLHGGATAKPMEKA